MNLRSPRLLAILVTLHVVGALQAADRFVSTATGRDTNPGTLTAPWKTVQRAAGIARPGDTIYLRAGTYREKVQINVSGTASAPIVFCNYKSEVVIFDLGDVNPPATMTAIIRIPSRSYVTIKGFELRNYRTTASACTPIGILIDGASVGVQILNNRIHHIEQNNIIRNNFNANAHGIAAYGTSATPLSNLVISGNQVYSLRLGASEAIALNGNVTGFTVASNIVRDCNNIGIDVIGYEGTSRNAALDRARSGVIRGNTIYNISSATNPAYGGTFTKGGGDLSAAGIYVDGGTGVLIERNQIYGCNYGIELASEYGKGKTDFITVRDNLVRHNHLAGLTMGGYDQARGVTENCTILNNTFYQNDTATSYSGQIQFQFYVRNNSFKNNILWASTKTRQILVHAPDSSQATSAQKEFGTSNLFAANLYFASGTGNVTFEVFSKGKDWEYSNVVSWQTSGLSAGDVGSSFANPKFAIAIPAVTSPATAYKLTAGSPAINTGVPSFKAAVGEFDFYGEPRLVGGRIDRGADEY